MRLAYKQLSFSRYAYDGEDQCLSPLPHNGDLSEEAKEKSSSENESCRWSKEAASENAKETRRRSERRRTVEKILQSDLQT